MKKLANSKSISKWLAIALSLILVISIFSIAGCQPTVDDSHVDADKDHLCDCGCGKTFGDHKDINTDHVCYYGCKEAIGEHADADKDHVCDYGCKEAIGECADADNNHLCDYGCGKAFGECADKDEDGLCDYGCGKSFKVCKDENKDHACDCGCDEVFGEHTDADKDHVCDYGCKVAIGEHKDTNNDHICEYGCKVAIGECADADKDHKCDYGCDEVFGEHKDTNNDHVCEYGCKVAIGECADADKDHKCDYGCDEVFGEHKDTNNDHVCEYGCKVAIGECIDADKDHKCDYGCDEVFGEHKDTNNDHVCEYGCKVVIGECADADTDHKCDYGCDEVFGEHKDTNNDHVCEYGCKVVIGECADADTDHKCDYGCDEVFGEHKDTNNDHVCEYGCKVAIGECADADTDHDCDYGCGKNFGIHEAAEGQHACNYCGKNVTECADENKDHVCDYGCNVTIGEHIDANNDHVCEYGCNEAIGECVDTDPVDHKCDYGCDKTFGEHVDDNFDHACDHGCNETIGAHEAAEKSHNCAYCNQPITTCEGNYDNGSSTATCTNDGKITYTCTVCGATKTEDAPALGHDDTDGDLVCDNGECNEKFYVITLTDAVASGDSKNSSTIANAFVAGEKVTITADAYKTVSDVKYMFVGFDLNEVDNRVGDLGNPKYTFNMPEENFTLTAAYAEANTTFLSLGTFKASEASGTAGWTGTVITDSADEDLEGLSGYSFVIPDNAQGTDSIAVNISATKFTTWGIDQTKLAKIILKNHSEYDVTIELVAEYFGSFSSSGSITITANDVVTVYMTMEAFLGKSGNVDIGILLRDSIGGDGNGTVQLDVVACLGKKYESKPSDLVATGGTYMQYGEYTDIDDDGISETTDTHPKDDGVHLKNNNSALTVYAYDTYGAIYVYWDSNDEATEKQIGRVRGDMLGDEAISLKTLHPQAAVLEFYVKVTNMGSSAGTYTLAYTRGSAGLTGSYYFKQQIVFTEGGESVVYKVTIDVDSIGSKTSSDNLQLGIIREPITNDDGTTTNNGKMAVLVQAATTNIFGQDAVNE